MLYSTRYLKKCITLPKEFTLYFLREMETRAMKKNYEAPNAEWLAFSLREALMDSIASGVGQSVGDDPVNPEDPDEWG